MSSQQESARAPLDCRVQTEREEMRSCWLNEQKQNHITDTCTKHDEVRSVLVEKVHIEPTLK
jgi:hypothetical protein